MTKYSSALLIAFSGSFSIAMLATGAMAAENDYTLATSARYEYLDNPDRKANSDLTDTATTAIVDVGIRRSTANVDADVNYMGRLVDYRHDSLEDRKYFTGDSTLRWKIKPEVFSWALTNNRSMQLLSASSADTLDNRQIVDVTSTGPQLDLRVAGTDVLHLDYNYSLASFERNTVIDQTRQNATISYRHYVSQRLAVSATAYALTSEYDNAAIPGFDRYNYSASADYTTDQLTLSAELGGIDIRREGQTPTNGDLIRLETEYKINTRSTFTASYSSNEEDIISNLNSFQPSEDLIIGDRLGDSNLTSMFRQLISSIGYRYAAPDSFTLSLEASEQERRVEVGTNNYTDQRVNINLGVPFGQNIKMRFFARHSDMVFPDQLKEQQRVELGVTTNYRVTNRLSLNFSFLNTDQTSNQADDEYDGINAFMEFAYRIH